MPPATEKTDGSSHSWLRQFTYKCENSL